VVNFYCTAWCGIPGDCDTFQLLTHYILTMAVTCEKIGKLKMCPTSLDSYLLIAVLKKLKISVFIVVKINVVI
jgi:hypothetical protein